MRIALLLQLLCITVIIGGELFKEVESTSLFPSSYEVEEEQENGQERDVRSLSVVFSHKKRYKREDVLTTQKTTTTNRISHSDEEADEEVCPAWLSRRNEVIIRSSPSPCRNDKAVKTTTVAATKVTESNKSSRDEKEETTTEGMDWSSTNEPVTTWEGDSTSTEDAGTPATEKTPTKLKFPSVSITRDGGEEVHLYFVDESTTWMRAHLSCRKMGLNLGEFRSRQESDDALKMYRSNHCNGCKGTLWVGAQRQKGR
ncbi:hypothetical protein Aduo_004181 [Ancylostoma duodenale]